MPSPYASGKKTWSFCDRCGQRFRLKVLATESVRSRQVNNKVCPSCFDPDHPQNFQGMYPIDDPQAVRDPRPDTAMLESRDYAWSWAPVGGGSDANGGPPNPLAPTGYVGTVTVSIS
jgi:hypothetical protein